MPSINVMFYSFCSRQTKKKSNRKMCTVWVCRDLMARWIISSFFYNILLVFSNLWAKQNANRCQKYMHEKRNRNLRNYL